MSRSVCALHSPAPLRKEDLVQKSFGFLRDILGYELESAERYRRFVSLVMVSLVGDGREIETFLAHKMRDCDVMANLDGSVLILMSETNRQGAETAIERYKKDDLNGYDPRFSLVTFPKDGRGVDTLFSVATRRLQKALGRDPGTVIATG